MLKEADSIKYKMTLQRKTLSLSKPQDNITQKLAKDQEDHEEMWEIYSVMALTEIPEMEEIVIGCCG